ncbi:MAG: precorrin-2 C(20)-methyltransferase [Desulfovibrio sp.]|jgi:precorrin-2/cobalt-factor-2 C20-methyltransferase|nr:precorrin-2 C(20)-methyltransferase [Desulfovibrio sp.]
MQPGKLYGIGIGPGDPELLTLKGARILAECDVIFTVISQHVSESVSGAVVEAVRPKGRVERLTFSMSRDPAERQAMLAANAQRIADELVQGRTCAYTTLGDTLTYSTYGYMLKILRQTLPDLEVETVPGVTSFATLAARADAVLVENTEDLRVVPAFKASMAESIEFPKGSSTVLLKTYRSRNALIRRLRQEKDLKVLYGERLTMEGEFISRDLDEIEARPECYFSLMLVRRP